MASNGAEDVAADEAAQQARIEVIAAARAVVAAARLAAALLAVEVPAVLEPFLLRCLYFWFWFGFCWLCMCERV